MSYSFLIGAAIFIICWFMGRRRIDFALDKLPKPSREALFNEVEKSEVSFQFTYIFIFLFVFGIFDVFPTIHIAFKFVAAMAFLIFTVSTGYGAVARVHRLGLPGKVLHSVLSGFALIISGFVAFVILIRDSLTIRIWH